MTANRRRPHVGVQAVYLQPCASPPSPRAYALKQTRRALLSDAYSARWLPPDDQTTEALACVTCRARKLKCNRVKPACSRCVRVRGECVYPESRRKPAFKRRNVKELEARLGRRTHPRAQPSPLKQGVETLLKEVGSDKASAPGKEMLDEPTVEFDFAEVAQSQSEDVFFQGMDYTVPSASVPGDAANMYSFSFSTDAPGEFGNNTSDFFGGELLGLGISEPTPPLRGYGRARYLQEFYSPPHMKPPMCLQYAIWSIAALENEKYRASSEVFYQRARQYAEADEMKGQGEHFLTVRHAQAWACIAVCEAKTMLFTRAAMSAARAVRLAEMMGLQRLDFAPGEMSPTTSQARWSSVIFFNEILKHVHRPRPDDFPENYEFGRYWTRHRELDNKLSSAFMFLPEGFRLPDNYRDRTAVHTNLNLHASIICLHHAAIDKIDRHKLPNHLKKASQTRLLTAAQAIVEIMKTIGPTKSHPVVADIECNDLKAYVNVPKLDFLPSQFATSDCNIPLLVRSAISRHSGTPAVPGQVPPKVTAEKMKMNASSYSMDCGVACLSGGVRDPVSETASSPVDHASHKRKRQAPDRSPAKGTSELDDGSPLWAQTGSFGYSESLSSDSTPPDSSLYNAATNSESCRPRDLRLDNPSPGTRHSLFPMQSLPHRTGSPAVVGSTQHAPSTGSGTNSGGVALGPTITGSRQTLAWDMAGNCLYSQFQNGLAPDNATTDAGSWDFLGIPDQIDWGTGAGIATDIANATD
ncbi:hypothetical protein PG999_005742 [Apiospora kogelbergensis]|uniref:Zn(2)-C6 fungal-type domain-containing protein n=1 Tax=Apiospora kogelbergensis TaxID=1337665 RepID=A0AAW0QT01_9PEZI